MEDVCFYHREYDFDMNGKMRNIDNLDLLN